MIFSVHDWWKLLSSPRSSLRSRCRFCKIEKQIKRWWCFRRRPRRHFHTDKHFLFHSGKGMPHSLILEGQCGPFPLKYPCQQLDKFLEGTCWNLFVPLVPGLHGGFCSQRRSKTVAELRVDIHFFLFNASLQLQKPTNQKKKNKIPCVKAYLGSSKVLSPFPVLASGCSAPAWSGLLGMGCTDGEQGLGIAWMVKHECAQHQPSSSVQKPLVTP